MNITTIVLMIIFVFIFIPLVIAEVTRAKFRWTLEDFFLQSRTMPLIMAFFTIYATWVSSFAFLGSTKSFFQEGPLYMTSFAWNVLFAVLFYLVGRRIWYYGKSRGYITATDFFDDIYRNRLLSLSVTIIIAVFTIPYLVIQLYGGAFLIETVSNGLIPWKAAGLLFYLVIIIYLWAGGLRAVALADIYYGILTFVTMLIAGVALIQEVDGPRNAFQTILSKEDGYCTLGGLGDSNSVLMWLAMFLVIPIGAFMGPPIWIRMYSIANQKIFKILPLLLAIIPIMYMGPLLAGITAKYLYPNVEASDNLLVMMIMEKLPIIMAVVILCGIAAASLSTANSQIQAMAAIYAIDIHRRYINPKVKERQLLNVGKWAVLAVSVAAYMLILFSSGSIVEIGTLSFSGTMQIFVPTVGALAWDKSNSKAAFVGVWVGTITSLVCWWILKYPTVYAAIIGFIFNIVLFVVFSLILPENSDVKNRIVMYKNEFAENIGNEQ
ncbi:MAG: sodium:solute symporter family protein [Clostridiales bacterium]|nr:sodium:solute symporter family protein [Clostridiales bacterium]